MEAQTKAVPVQSVKKALDLLDLLVFEDLSGDGVSLRDLAARMGQPANSTHNLLKTMVACGYAAQGPNGRYRAGPRCRAIGRWNWVTSNETGLALEAELDRISEQLKEGVVFSALVDGRWVSVARRSADQAVQVAPQSMHADNVYTVSTGRILTAFASAEELEAILDRHGMPGKRWDNIRTRKALDKHIAAVRAQGACVMSDERRGTVMFACPVLAPTANGHGPELLGALGCHAPLYRCSGKKLDATVKKLQSAAKALGARLG